jgi:hypothetical protein
MEVIGFCASHYGIQMAVPVGQSPAGLLAAVLVHTRFTYNDNPFMSVDTGANRMKIVFAFRRTDNQYNPHRQQSEQTCEGSLLA